MIREFSCRNFRNINVNRLQLSRINILIGPNNSGKSNFIKALTFYSNMLKHAQDGSEGTDFFNAMERNGWARSKNFGADIAENVSFEWHMDFDAEPVVYRFAYNVGARREDFHIALEELNAEDKAEKYNKTFNYFRAHQKKIGNGNFSTALKKGKENKRIPVKLDSSKTIFSQFDQLLLEKEALYNADVVRKDIYLFLKKLEDSFKSFYLYSSAGFDTKQMRKRVDAASQGNYLRSDGSNLANVINQYKTESLLWKKDYTKLLRLVIRDLEDIDVINQRDTLSIRLVEEDKELELSDISEGTLKALIWGTLLCLPGGRCFELLAIDEPECNMHPAWQKVFADVIQESRSYKQCLISTHSPDFLDQFTVRYREEQDIAVYVFDLQGNVRQIHYSDIAEDLGDWQLGDLYRTQDPALGGWPW